MQGSDEVFSLNGEHWKEDRSYNQLFFCSHFFTVASAFSHHLYHHHVSLLAGWGPYVSGSCSCDRGAWCAAPQVRLLAADAQLPLHVPSHSQTARPREGRCVWSLCTPYPSYRAVQSALTFIPPTWCPASLCCCWTKSPLVSKAKARLPLPQMRFNHTKIKQ